jgi:hypothetical protein
MKSSPQSKAPIDRQLGVLAMKFRSTRDGSERAAIAQSHATAVNRLIGSGKWREIPSLEDQLPDDWMPAVFFDFWSLGKPNENGKHRATTA